VYCHFVALLIESSSEILNRSYNFALLIRQVPQKQIDIPNEFDRRVAAIDEEFLNSSIGVIKEQFAFCGFTVPPGSTRLLVVRFQRTGYFKMNHEPKVSAIDTHPERIRGDDDVAVVLREPVLRFFSSGVVDAAVVTNDPDPA
jgi:hypothetical protein